MLHIVVAIFMSVAVAVGEDPKPGEAARLVEQLGSDEYAEREAATRRLNALGPAAIEELRAASRSNNPERVRRALVLLRRAERNLADEKLLAPTLVQIEAADSPLDAVLAEISTQAKCEVVLGIATTPLLAAKKITLSTGGKVPFWAAILRICDAADLQIAAAWGYLAPGASPVPRNRPGAATRSARNVNLAVVLEPRGEAKRRPAFIKGAVLVEAIPFPKTSQPNEPSVLLQAWPEPRLQWDNIRDVIVAKAIGANGARLVGRYVSPPVGYAVRGRERVVLIRNPDGSVTAASDGGFTTLGTFKPNLRQAVIAIGKEDQKTERVEELELSLFASVRGAVEPLCVAGSLEPNKTVRGEGNTGVSFSITYRKNETDRLIATVELVYDAKAVQPAGVSDELPGDHGDGGRAVGNRTIHGVRVEDADGKPYTMGLMSGTKYVDATGRSVVQKLQFELRPDKGGGLGPPASATFWGTSSRTVAIPVRLGDIPVAGSKPVKQ